MSEYFFIANIRQYKVHIKMCININIINVQRFAKRFKTLRVHEVILLETTKDYCEINKRLEESF